MSPNKTGGGRFDPQGKHIYFIAANAGTLRYVHEVNAHMLVAVNEVMADEDIERFDGWLADPTHCLFLDSGVYNLAMTWARKHNVHMDVGLSMAPEDIEGFQPLFDRYVEVVTRYEDKLWGYIEIDQGGRDNKIKTRTKLEALGLRPIPVYHPLNDGWEYFDYLAERYDRLCIGNIVAAEPHVRKRLVATIWERRRTYPHVWIHLLGLTPNIFLDAYPIDSGDSSSWLAAIRWTNFRVHAHNAICGYVTPEFRYPLQREDGSVSQAETTAGRIKATELCGYKATLDTRSWHAYLDELRAHGFFLNPPATQEVRRASH